MVGLTIVHHVTQDIYPNINASLTSQSNLTGYIYLNLSTVLTALLTLCSRLSVGASSNEVRTELIGRIRDAKS